MRADSVCTSKKNLKCPYFVYICSKSICR